MNALIRAVHALSPDVCHVAVYRRGILATSMKNEETGASAGRSDSYEARVVLPTLLSLLTQRDGNDDGDPQFILIRYGDGFGYIAPIDGGHVSVEIQGDAEALVLAERIQQMIAEGCTNDA